MTGVAAAQDADGRGTSETLFDRAMDAALFNAGSTASLLRCTGLFRAFRVYAGAASDVGREAALRETDLAVAAVVIWQAETGTRETEAAFEVIVPMVTDATDLFLARLSSNLDETGAVFDAALETELAYCNALHGEIAAGGGGPPGAEPED